ncbi:MAG: class I SAM-dependent methyltransferase [Patescibacteria group bacterium]|jgi:ubiquinone/menaquinone biosynthesis C-methylase UbiE
MAKNNSNQFDRRPPTYLEGYEGFRLPKSFQEIDAGLSHLEKKDHLRIADVMCGTGIVGKHLLEVIGADKITKMVFIDGSQKMLDAIETTLEKFQAFAEKLPFKDESFDLLVVRAGFNNVEKGLYVPILQELLRVLAKDGVLIVQDHFPIDEQSQIAVNALELQIAEADGRNDTPYIPTTVEFGEMVQAAHGKIMAQSEFEFPFNFTDRFKSKGLSEESIAQLNTSILAQSANRLQVKIVGDDILITHPITTFTITKES